MVAPTKKLNESALAPLAVYSCFLHSKIASESLPAFFKHSIPSPVLTHASLLQARASWPAPSSAVATVFQVSLLDTELQASEKAPESVSPTSENQSREKTVSALTFRQELKVTLLDEKPDDTFFTICPIRIFSPVVRPGWRG